jgi:hypothetical protein
LKPDEALTRRFTARPRQRFPRFHPAPHESAHRLSQDTVRTLGQSLHLIHQEFDMRAGFGAVSSA